jgi:hypothetical protein
MFKMTTIFLTIFDDVDVLNVGCYNVGLNNIGLNNVRILSGFQIWNDLGGHYFILFMTFSWFS